MSAFITGETTRIRERKNCDPGKNFFQSEFGRNKGFQGIRNSGGMWGKNLKFLGGPAF